jgi:hypothetical protein
VRLPEDIDVAGALLVPSQSFIFMAILSDTNSPFSSSISSSDLLKVLPVHSKGNTSSANVKKRTGKSKTIIIARPGSIH